MDAPPGAGAEDAHGGPAAAAAAAPTSPAIADAVTLRSDDPEALRERIEKYKGLVARLKAALAEERSHRAQSDVKLAALEPFAAAFAGSLLGAISADATGRPAFDVVAKVALPAEECSCGAAAAASHAPTCSATVGGTWVCLRGRPSTAASTGPSSSAPAAAAAVGTPTQWHAEAAVLAAFPSLKGELAALPVHAPPDEAADLRRRLEEANEEMRRFRVRAEALLRQRDGELASAREAALALRSTTILHTGTGTGTGAAGSATASSVSNRAGDSGAGGADAASAAAATGELADLRVALHRAVAESKARDVHWRDRLADARSEIQQLRGELEALKSKASTTAASAADTSASGSGSTGTPSSAGAADTPPGSASASSAGSASALAQEVSLLRLLQEQKASEFAAYRQRTAALVVQKDELVSKLTADVSELRKQVRALKVGVAKAGLDVIAMLAAAGVDDGAAPVGGADTSAPPSATTPVKQHRSDSAFGTPISTPGAGAPPPTAVSPSGASSSSTRSPLADAGRWQYFRTIMMRYLSTPDSQASVRTALEPAIMAVMGLTPHEIAAVQKASGRSPAGHASGAGLADAVGTVAAEASGFVSSAVTSVSSLWASWSGSGAGGGGSTSGTS